ncbi:MAG TPA: hypothetical protein VK108_06680 [Pseudogracilibacillus sp.]|nr:hypothetical protein [Pseudogracilibacillus sp.]
MAYKIFIRDKFDGSFDEVDDEVYESREEAEEALDEVANNFMTGAETLELAGESFSEPDDYEFKVKKV